MTRNRNYRTLTMVNLEQIASRKYRGCTTARAVQNFCTRFRVNRFWWQPPAGSKKILMVDWQNFYRCWYQAYAIPSTTRPAISRWRSTGTQYSRRGSPRRTRSYSTRNSTFRGFRTTRTTRRAA